MGAMFAGGAVFRKVTFSGVSVEFGAAEFAESPEFNGARVAQSPLDVSLDRLAELGELDRLEKLDELGPLAELLGKQKPPFAL